MELNRFASALSRFKLPRWSWLRMDFVLEKSSENERSSAEFCAMRSAMTVNLQIGCTNWAASTIWKVMLSTR
jgi:hypothetical protein